MLQRLASVGQGVVADAVGVDEATISRLKNPETKIGLRALATMLDRLGLKVVPLEMKCFNPADINPYIQLAKRHMASVQDAAHLEWDDDNP